MGTVSFSIILILSAVITIQCLPNLQDVDGGADDLELSDDTELHNYRKRDWRQYVCKYVKGRFPHEHECHKYYDCSDGDPKLRTCPKGEYFDSETKKCKDSQHVKCKGKKGSKETSGSSESKEASKFKCVKHSDGNFPHETDCKKYFSCKKGKSKSHTCPKKELYDVGDEECRSQERVHCGNRENPYDPESKTDFQCPKSKGSFPHEEDCTKYYTCKDGLSRLRTCPKSKLFDVGREECDNHEDVHCGNKINPYDPNSKTNFQCPKSRGSFPHEEECGKYYSCKDDLARLRTCPKKKLFDVGKKECENQEDVHCGNKINPYDPESRTEFQCPKSKGTFSHEDNCTKYYSCKDGVAKLIMCPNKKLYDVGRDECHDHKEVHCGNKYNPYEPTFKRIDFECPKSKGEYPHDTECDKYYSCKHGLAKVEGCPKHKLFDAERQECRDSKKVKCWGRINPEGETFVCPVSSFFWRDSSDGLYPDPSDCKKYYTCISGKPKSKTCPRDERFDPKKRSCVRKNRVKCDVETEDENEEFVCPASKIGNFSVDDDCSLYHFCQSKVSQPKSCPQHQLYDIKTAKCQDSKDVDCDSRFNPYEDESEISDEVDYKCPKQNGLFPHEKDCRSYYNCHNGVATVDSCPHGKLFDVFKKRCADEKYVNCDDPIDPNAIHIKHRRHRYRYFWCPRSRGTFFHRLHCGLFYHCWHRRPSIRSCSGGRFFDIFRRRCYDKDFVDCGHRNRRDDDKDDSKESEEDEFKCPSSSGKYPHESECGKYYECNRKKASLKTCPNGKLYDVKRRQCERHYRVDCGDRNDGEGVIDENNDFKCPTSRGNYPYKEDCSRYFSCSNKKPTLKACPVGQLYDVERGDCEKDYRVDCGGRPRPDGTKEPVEDTFKCPTASGNFPHEVDCKKYYSCSNNFVTGKKCRRGQMFDVNRGSCEQSNRVDCGGRIDDSSSSQEDSSEDGYKCPTSRGNHPHPSCHMYYSCSNKIFTLKKCPEGQLYDVRRKDCDRWDKVDCGSRKSQFDKTTTVTPLTSISTSATKLQTFTDSPDVGTVTVNPTSSSKESENTLITDKPWTGNVTENPNDKLSTIDIIEGRTGTGQFITEGTASETEEQVSLNPTTAKPSTESDKDSKIVCPTSFGLHPHKKDCKKYYYCNNSVPVLMTCNGSEMFDARKSKCSQNNVDCGRRQSLDDSEEESEEPSYRCPSSQGNYPHEECQWYYVCDKKKYTLKQCPQNKLFDTKKHKCETSDRVDCGGRQLPFDRTTDRPASSIFPITGDETEENNRFTSTNYPMTEDITTRKPITGKIINTEGSDATDSFTESSVPDTFTKRQNENTGTGNDITSVTNSRWPVTSTRKPSTGSDSWDITDSYTGQLVTGSRRPGTVSDSGDATETYTGWPVTSSRRPGTVSDSGYVTDTYTGLPVTSSRRPGTVSNSEYVTDTYTGQLITGSRRPGTVSDSGYVTDTYTGLPVTSSRRPGTVSDSGDVTDTNTGLPVTGSRRPGTVSDSEYVTDTYTGQLITGSRRPGTVSDSGDVTDTYTGWPVTGSRRPGTVSDSGYVTDTTGWPVTGSRRPGTVSDSGDVTDTTGWPVTGSRRPGTVSDSGDVTDTYTRWPVTGSRRPGTVSDSGGVTDTTGWPVTGSRRPGTVSDSGDVTDTYTGWPVTGSRRPGTVSDSGDVTDTYTRWPVTGSRRPGTVSDSGDVTDTTGWPVTGSRRPGTVSDSGDVTDTTGWPVTGSRRPGTVSDSGDVTDTYTGWPVTGSRRPGTVSDSGDVTDTYTRWPVTGSRRPGTVSDSGGVTDTTGWPVTGSRRPGTVSDSGGVTDRYTGWPVTGSRRPGTVSDSGDVTDTTGWPVTGSRRPGTVSDSGDVTDRYTGWPVTGSRRPGTVSDSGDVTDTTGWPVTGSRRPGTVSDSGDVTDRYTGWPVTGSRRPGTVSDSGDVTDTTGWPVTGSRRPGTVSDSGDITHTHTELPVTSSRRPGTVSESGDANDTYTGWPITGSRRPGTVSPDITVSPKIVSPDGNLNTSVSIDGKLITTEMVTGSEVGRETSSGETVEQTMSSHLFTETSQWTVDNKVTNDKFTKTSPPVVVTVQSTTDHGINNDEYICPTESGNYPFKDDCSKYYKCKNGRPLLMKCSEVRLFDAKRNKCTFDDVDCGSRYDPYASDESKELKHDCPTSKEGQYPHEFCDRYIVCSQKKYKIVKCGPFQLYDAIKRKCKPEYQVDCGGRCTHDKGTTTMTSGTPNDEDLTVVTTSSIYITNDVTVPSKNTMDHTKDNDVTINQTVTIKSTDFNTATSTPVTRDVTKIATEITTGTETVTPGIGKLTTKTVKVDTTAISKEVVPNELTTTTPRFVTPKLITSGITTEKPDGILLCPEANGLFPHPDVHKFVHCSNWEANIKDCPGTLVFNRKLKVCSWTLSFIQEIP